MRPAVDGACAAGLALLTVASRWAYRARMLYNWDAVQFALALREYDVAKHQPHPPGYILYVGLGRLVHAWVGDPAAAYVVLAVLFSGLTTVAVYVLALAAYGRATALAAATLLAVSPLFWFYGAVGLTYAGEALGAAVVAAFAYRALRGSEVDAWLAAGYLGLAAGLRQPLLVLMGPLWLGATWVGLRRFRTVGIGLLILTGATLTWAVPMVWLTGGLGRYLEASWTLAESVVRPTTVVGGPIAVTGRMFRHLLESTLVGLGPLALAVALLPWYVRRHGWTSREGFFVGWVATPSLVYTFVHFGQAGYVLTFLPALVILLTHVLLSALRAGVATARPPWAVAVVTGTVGLLVVANGAFFVSARPQPRDFDTPRPGWRQVAEADVADWVLSRTAAALREHEAVVRTYVETIRGLYPAEETAVITEVGNPRSYPWLRHAMYYLGEYPIYELSVGPLPPGVYAPRLAFRMSRLPAADIRLPRGIRRLVWFVDYWNPAAPRPPGLVEIELPYGRYLYVLPLGRRPVNYAGYTFLREEPPRRSRRGG
jgi:4-amino-4-deoxy-L-arabinose transferase-like glycosyltransferase